MEYNEMYIFVEGADDQTFFDMLIKPILERKYTSVIVQQHSGEKKENIEDFIRSIKSMDFADYIFVVDINNAPCVTAKKKKIFDKYKNIDEEKIAIVIREIESWYFAGLSDEDFQKFKIHSPKVTDNIDKQKFNSLIPKKFDSRIDFMLEILKYFCIKIAKQRNGSFKYFIEKYNC